MLLYRASGSWKFTNDDSCSIDAAAPTPLIKSTDDMAGEPADKAKASATTGPVSQSAVPSIVEDTS